MLRPESLPQTQYDVIPLAGGFDQVTSAYQLSPGALRDCINFACRSTGGYYRVPGYERFDGRFQPHLAQFVALDITLLPGKSIAVGDIGAFGNINGTVSYVDPFGKYISLTKTTTTFSTTFVPGPIVISADTKGTANAYHTQLTQKELAVNRAAAANIYRADIGAVPGSGPIRGVVFYNDVAYAFRDNAAGTAEDIYKSTTLGWVKVQLGQTVAFTDLKANINEGDTLTQGGVTATVERWIISSGDITSGTNTGYFVVSNISGGSFTAAAATVGTAAVTLGGAQQQIVLSPGGDYNFSIGNFSAYEATRRIYGADGINDAFEFDGEVYVPIPVPGIVDKPSLAQTHANHLFLAVSSSIIHSALGNPYNFEVVNGAGEIGTGGRITGMLIMPGNQSTQALMVFARNSTWILYGTSSQDWNFTNYNVGIGAWEGTPQNLFDAFALDDRGVTQMKQTLNYGNFDAATLTYNIRPFIQSQRGLAVCSALSRENSQYRVYFSTGYGLYVTTNPQGFVGHGIVLFPNIPTCYWDSEYFTGETVALFGDKDGFVYRNDVGTSFDGKVINAYLNTNINSSKSPRLRKRYRRCVLELQGDSYIEMQVGYSFEWASERILPHAFEDGSMQFAGLSFWDEFIWDTFFWDGRSNDTVSVELAGTGENMQMMIVLDADYVEQFTIPSVIFHYTPRRGNR